jgi:hypothetical protein
VLRMLTPLVARGCNVRLLTGSSSQRVYAPSVEAVHIDVIGSFHITNAA